MSFRVCCYVWKVIEGGCPATNAPARPHLEHAEPHVVADLLLVFRVRIPGEGGGMGCLGDHTPDVTCTEYYEFGTHLFENVQPNRCSEAWR